jgi:hypothetical protein
MSDDAFNKWFDKRINEETLPTVEEAFKAGHNLAWEEYRAWWQDEKRKTYDLAASDKVKELKGRWPDCHFLYKLWETTDLRYENYDQYSTLLDIYYKKLFGDNNE